MIGLAPPSERAPAEHTKKEVRQALKEILATGNWDLYDSAHWGALWCRRPCRCKIPVFGTPRVPSRHARDLHREAARCPIADDSGYRKPQAG